jgi:acetyl-CoA synthetase
MTDHSSSAPARGSAAIGDHQAFAAAVAALQDARGDLARARRVSVPSSENFNWAFDHFDLLPADRTALILASERGDTELTFGDLQVQSRKLASGLADAGIRRGDHILLMLGNVAPLWQSMLAAMRLGAVVIPATVLLRRDDVVDRLERGEVTAIIADTASAAMLEGLAEDRIRICVGSAPSDWHRFDDVLNASSEFLPDAPTHRDDPLLLYFTSGTTSRPKLVEHTHASYPVGHLSTMYWIGLRAGDVHLNISSSGWAKHAWSSFFAPWTAGATIVALAYSRFDAGVAVEALRRYDVTTFCAPPTVWRMLVQGELGQRPPVLRELVSAGEPLNPAIIDEVEHRWGLTVRDGYGQTETTAMIANPPEEKIRKGSMGRPLPGYEIVLLDPDGQPAEEGEICLPTGRRQIGLMLNYRGSDDGAAQALRDGFYHTGDVAQRDADGYLTFVGRTDDVFKSSDYRISPFELESVLIEHPAIAEAAVVPSPDPTRLAVPKAFVTLARGASPDLATATSVLAHCRAHLPPFKRIRRLEFVAEFPKTVSGKIRRAELKEQESTGFGSKRGASEFWEEDLPKR